MFSPSYSLPLQEFLQGLGDLKDPKKSIPRGTLIATIVGAFIYVMVALKLVTSTSLANLANNQMVIAILPSGALSFR